MKREKGGGQRVKKKGKREVLNLISVRVCVLGGGRGGGRRECVKKIET